MARPLRVEYPGALYHIISRGNEGKTIFSNNRDREKFIQYIEYAYIKFKIKIHAYCLMSNHYHLLVETPIANLSKCMQFINSSYTSYFNTKRNRKGHLFQGRYKGILVENDSYYHLQRLSRYIHLNPVRAKLVEHPQEYQWSSYQYYLSSKKSPLFLDTQLILKSFGKKRKRHEMFVEEGLNKKIKDPFEDLKAGFILGAEDFIESIKEKYLKGREETRDLPSLRKIRVNIISPEYVLDVLQKEIGTFNDKENKKVMIYLLRKYTQESLQELAKRLSDKKITVSCISKIVSRLEQERKKNRKLDLKIKKIEKKMSNV